MVLLSLQHINYFSVLISETEDPPGSCFWALLPKVLWPLAHPRRENRRLFVLISSFQEQSLFGDLLIPSPPLVPMFILAASCQDFALGQFSSSKRDTRAPAAQTFCSAMPDQLGRVRLAFYSLPRYRSFAKKSQKCLNSLDISTSEHHRPQEF